MADTLTAQASGLLFVIAIVVYVLAMIGFSVDLAGSAQRRSDARLERKVARPAARVGSAGASGVAVLDRDGVGAAGETGRPAGTGHTAAASGGGPTGGKAAPEGMSAGTFAMIMACAGAVLHIGGVVLRGLATHRVPWSNMYEFAMTGSAVVIALFLGILLRRRDLRVLGTFVIGPMLILMLIAQRLWYVPAAALPPSLQNSHWLVIHVSVAIFASALFTIGAVISVLQLLQARREKRGDEPAAPTTRGGRVGARAWTVVGPVLDRLPSSKDLEALAFRIHAVAFVMWSFTLIFGSIWASSAWGRYWGWDPKEVWTFVIWVVYAAYLHARATVGFRGGRAAWFALAGFACVIFNFTIVNTVINGLHSYSGLT